MKEKGNFFKAVDKAEDVCLVSMFVLMVAAIFLQVIMRFVFNNSLTWSEELGKFIFVWISWLGISIAERKNEHIKITLVTDRMSPKWRTVCEIVASICVLLILGVIVAYAVKLVIFQQRVHYAGIKISTSWGYLSLVIGCGFMILRVIGGIIRNIGILKSGNYPVDEAAEAAPEGGAN